MRRRSYVNYLAQSAALLLALGSVTGCQELQNIGVTDDLSGTDSAMDLNLPVDAGTDLAMRLDAHEDALEDDGLWMKVCDDEAYNRGWSTCRNVGEKFFCIGKEFDHHCECVQSYELLHWFCYSRHGYGCEPEPYRLLSHAGDPCAECEIGRTFFCGGEGANMACCTCSAEKVGPRWRCTYNQQCFPSYPIKGGERCEADLAEPVDQGTRDLAAPADLRAPADLARPPDVAVPKDLGPPADAARDLSPRG